MPPIDVVLIGITGMLSQIVKAILNEPDIRVRAELPLHGSVMSEVRNTAADVLIVADDDGAVPPFVRELFGERPRTKVLTIHDDGRETFLYELRPFQTRLGQVSPQTLLDAVRTARTAPL